jgi:hypothetical protein
MGVLRRAWASRFTHDYLELYDGGEVQMHQAKVVQNEALVPDPVRGRGAAALRNWEREPPLPEETEDMFG